MINPKKPALFLIFLLLSAALYSQTSMYLVPRQIYVGDPATLVLNLPATSHNRADIILTKNDSLLNGYNFPSDENIDFHRIILEQRTVGSRLMIEFTAFVTGLIELPVIEIDDAVFTGLTVTVNSLINNRSDRVLSGAASTLAMPGTAFMLYGSMAAFVVLVLSVIWFAVKGRTLFRELKEKWKRWRLFTGIRKIKKHLLKAEAKGTEKRLILDKLSAETRNFLSVLTGNNCRAMTAREFEMMPADTFTDQSQTIKFAEFFKHCDDLRFSGKNIDSRDILQLLADLDQFIDILEKSKRKDSPMEEKTA